MVGREIQDSEYAQWFYQCNLKVHDLCASLVIYFEFYNGYWLLQCSVLKAAGRSRGDSFFIYQVNYDSCFYTSIWVDW